MAIIAKKNDLANAGQNFRKKIQSDHLLIYIQIPMLPMTSIRTPRIDKMKMLNHFRNATKRDMFILRQHFIP